MSMSTRPRRIRRTSDDGDKRIETEVLEKPKPFGGFPGDRLFLVRTRKKICGYLGLTSVSYAVSRHVMPLVEQGLMCMSIPEKPKSQRRLFYTNPEGGGSLLF